MNTAYQQYIEHKLVTVPPTGLEQVPTLHPSLFPHQSDLVSWALKRGRCAIFAGTGLGKTLCELEYAKQVNIVTGKPVLILAPLAVAQQTVEEGKRFDITVTYCREQKDCSEGISITNYDRLHKFDPSYFGAVVLDESSCIKHSNSKSFTQLTEAFKDTPFKLCATATPSPNDFTELGTHAEFLGICTRQEMLSEFFIHDTGETQTWRLKGHAQKAFWQWVSSWGALIRMPSDLGHDDTGYILPPLQIHPHIIPANQADVFASGLLFAEPAGNLMERRKARKGSVGSRVEQCAKLVKESKDSWIVWVELNDESKAIKKATLNSVEISGADSLEEKEAKLVAFLTGDVRILITKPKIAGWGLNFQHCHNMAFVGVNDSWESQYQAIRRCYRFGQKHPVNVHLFASELEGNVVANLKRKEEDAEKMAQELSIATREMVYQAIRGQARTVNTYQPTKTMTLPDWMQSEVANDY